MNVYVYGLPFEPSHSHDGTPETLAREECEGAFGTTENCLVIDVIGRVMLNTTGVEVDRVYAS